ncbi:MAG TPA: ATP-binding protein [Treponemataceae bacterium]|nr:ATP-binding protein [Treponemataceae bacterium]
MQVLQRRATYVSLCVSIALFAFTGCNGAHRRAPTVHNGSADLSKVVFSAESVELDGQWLLFPEELLSPAEVDRRMEHACAPGAANGQDISAPVPVAVPGLWRTQEFRGKVGDTFGVGTMVLSMHLPENSPPLVFRLMLNQGSSRVFVNGTAADGALASDPGRPDLVPVGNPRYYFLPEGDRDVRIVIQKANWWDDYGAGIMTAPSVGSADAMFAIRNFNIGYESFLIGCLLFCALYHLMLYFLERRDRPLLFFSFISAAVVLRQLSINEKFWMSSIGVGHFTLLRIEHGSAYLVCALFILYFSALFPRYAIRPIKMVLIAAGAFGVAATFLPDPRFFTGMLLYLHSYIVLSAVFCFYIAIRAMLTKEPQSFPMLIGLCALVVPTMQDIMVTYQLVIVRYLMPLGFLPFVLIESYVLARRYARGTREAERLRVRTERLAELDRAKTAFIANVSHELRTPIALIKTPIEALQAGAYGESIPRGHPVFASVESNANRLLKLTENFLMMTRLDSGAALETVPIDIASILPRYVDDLAPMAKKAGIAIELSIGRDRADSPIVADIDVRAFDIIFFNLASNALKFTPTGGKIAISLSAIDGTVSLSVEDTGIGIAKESLSSIFTRYGKVYESELSNYDGNGIGLSLARDTAHAMGGDITATSEPGKGSRFTLTLPQSKSGATCHQNVRQSGYARLFGDVRPALATQESAAAEGARTRVLVVEDNDDMRRFVAECLSAENEIIEAVDGMDAKDKLDGMPLPDLVVCDVMMPRMDGAALFRYSRDNPRLSSLPFIMLTARDEGDEKVRILREGAVDYIVKPFKVDELRARVSTAVSRAKADRESLRRKMESAIAGVFSGAGLDGRAEHAGHPTREPSPSGLSHREAEVMDLVLQGMSDKEIADSLGISVRTASNHVASILRKTELSGRGELAAKFGPRD